MELRKIKKILVHVLTFIYTTVLNELKDLYNLKILKYDELEADDLIALTKKYLKKNMNIVIYNFI